MEQTVIKAKKTLHNYGECFTKGQTYIVNGYASSTASLMEMYATNNLGERHQIGGWWREFTIVKHN
jgi:hypothetical protein